MAATGFRLALALAAALALGPAFAAHGQTVLTPPASWAASSARRTSPRPPWPDIGKDCVQPVISETCRLKWLQYLADRGLSELNAAPGGRAYRYLWMAPVPGDLGLGIRNFGFVEVIIDPAGMATLRSSWTKGPVVLNAAAFAKFESALARTGFADLQSYTTPSCVDDCPYHLVEAVVDGRYHYVERDAGIREPGIFEAGAMLEKIAQAAAHRP